ncbi:hypothetical protein J6590_017036 [Homalodisca vitripennis]|nr:hypothetical protein J6590_017036 [Homalodisca vitripennis]
MSAPIGCIAASVACYRNRESENERVSECEGGVEQEREPVPDFQMLTEAQNELAALLSVQTRSRHDIGCG